ncbi:MAG: serine/threonine protein kinase [Lentisphaerales bacterium]|nr:serine/threonine protein kinase [Lentisphaerales bacterium]
MNEFKPQNDREKLVGELNPALEGFFDVDDVDFDDDHIFPIQNGLGEKRNLREIEEIARGGEKRILKTYDAQADRYVAMARPLDESSEGKERFLREARITASLEHPNIISVYEMSLDNNQQPFFTTELLEDKTLTKIIDDFHDKNIGQLEDLLDILLKVCDAVSYAHSHKILHLDIKPDNIQVGAFGNVLLIDWGLAKIINEDENLYLNESDLESDLLNDLTLTGTLKGSPGYMAPEQAGLKGDKNQQTDIYSLGALLHKILTGECHVKGETQQEILENTRKSNLSHLGEAIPVSLKAVCLKALHVSPTERYESVEDFRKELQAYLRGFATQAEEAGFMKQLSLLYKRRPLVFQVLFGALVIITLGTLGFIKELSLKQEEAVALQKEAEETLRLYEDGKRKRELMVDELDLAIGNIKNNVEGHQSIEKNITSLLVASAIGSSRKLDFEAAMEFCNIGLKDNPDNPLILAEKGFFHIIDHEFTAANKCFNDCATEAPHIFELHRVIKKYVKIKPDDSKRMGLQMTLDFIKELPKNRSWLKMFLLVRDKQLTNSMEDHSKLVKGYILQRNPELAKEDFNFEFTESEHGNKLSLAGSKGLTSLANFAGSQFKFSSLLYTLEIKYLDISDTDVRGLEVLKDLKLRELNIAGSKVLWPNHFKYLDREFLEVIMVKKGQLKGFSGSRFENIEVLELP